MSFMTKFWALIALAMVLAFGGNVPSAFANTNADIRACVDQRFAESPFTGTLEQKEAQARRLPADRPFGNPQITLPQGETLWDYCKTTPPALNIDQGRVTALEGANSALKREVTRLEGLAYETINARDRATGFVSDGSTWNDRAAALKDELDIAKTDAKFAGNLAWLLGIIGAMAIGFAIWLTTLVRKSGAALAQAKFTISNLQTRSWGGDTAADTGLDVPPTPGAKPAKEPEVPAFLDRLAK